MLVEVLNHGLMVNQVIALTLNDTEIGSNKIVIDRPLWDENNSEAIYTYSILIDGTEKPLQVLSIGRENIEGVIADVVYLRNVLTFKIEQGTPLYIVNMVDGTLPGINFSVTNDVYSRLDTNCWVKSVCNNNVNEYGAYQFSGDLLDNEVSEYEEIAKTILTDTTIDGRTIGYSINGLRVTQGMVVEINNNKYDVLRATDSTMTLSSPLPPLPLALVDGTVNQYVGAQTDSSADFDTGVNSTTHAHAISDPGTSDYTEDNDVDHTHSVGAHKHGLTGSSVIKYKDENFIPISASHIQINGIIYKINTVNETTKEITIHGELQSTLYDTDIIYSLTYPPLMPIKAAKWRVRFNINVIPILYSDPGFFRVKFILSDSEDTSGEEFNFLFHRKLPGCVVERLEENKYRIHFGASGLEQDAEYRLVFPKGLQDYFKTLKILDGGNFKAGENTNE